MTDKEILLDLLEDFTGTLQWTGKNLSLAALGWQPGVEANSIGVTLWHIGRSFDVLKVRVLQNKPYAEELWHTCGWATKTGYDPHGIGFGGWGTLARFTQADVALIPLLTAGELLTYFGQTKEAFHTYFAGMSAEMLYQLPAGWPDALHTAYQPATAYECIRNILMDTREHLGEIKALKAMWQRNLVSHLLVFEEERRESLWTSPFDRQRQPTIPRLLPLAGARLPISVYRWLT